MLVIMEGRVENINSTLFSILKSLLYYCKFGILSVRKIKDTSLVLKQVTYENSLRYLTKDKISKAFVCWCLRHLLTSLEGRAKTLLFPFELPSLF